MKLTLRNVLIAFLGAFTGLILILASNYVPLFDWNVRVHMTANPSAAYRIDLGKLPWTTKPWESFNDDSVYNRISIYAGDKQCTSAEVSVRVEVPEVERWIASALLQFRVWITWLSFSTWVLTALFMMRTTSSPNQITASKKGLVFLLLIGSLGLLLGYYFIFFQPSNYGLFPLGNVLSPEPSCKGVVTLAAQLLRLHPENWLLTLGSLNIELTSIILILREVNWL